MKVRLIFSADVRDSDDVVGLREQIAMCFEELGTARLLSVSPIKGSEPLKIERGTYGHVMLSDAGYEELVRRLGKGRAEALINELSYKLHQKGYSFKDHFAVILEWDKEEERGASAGASHHPTTRGSDGTQVKWTSFDVDEFFKANLERGIGK